MSTRKTKDDFDLILDCVSFGSWTFRVVEQSGSERCYLQIRARDRCVATGDEYEWGGRKWFLSPHMTRSEVVQTAFKAVVTALEHEARERFRYRGRSIFSPHYDVDRLWELRGEGASALDVREESGHG